MPEPKPEPIPVIEPKVDELQETLNDYVLNFPLPFKSGTCNFLLQQEYDDVLEVVKSVGAHNCKYYGVSL